MTYDQWKTTPPADLIPDDSPEADPGEHLHGCSDECAEPPAPRAAVAAVWPPSLPPLLFCADELPF